MEYRMITSAGTGRSWLKVGSSIALGYYALAVTALLIEYLSESNKLGRGMYTDTFNPLVLSDLVTWPTSIFVAEWKGYPRQAGAIWQNTLNGSVPSHIWAIVIQAFMIFLVVSAWKLAADLRRSKVRVAEADRHG
jgi:hypothetical protein